MGLSNYLPSSRLIQPGVCTSTTRPASPFEGQYIYETDTNRTLVYDGGAWVMTVDADTPPGMELVKVQTVGSAVSSVTVSSVFSSTFDSYKILYTGGTGTSGAWLFFNLNGTPQGWYGNLYYANFASGSVATVGMSNATNCNYVGGCISSTFDANIELRGPNTTTPTFLNSPFIDANNAGQTVGCLANTTSYTGFTLTPNTGTLTGGTIRVYGYRNTI